MPLVPSSPMAAPLMAPEGGEKEEWRMEKGGRGLTVCFNNRLSAGGTSRPTLWSTLIVSSTLPPLKMLKVPRHNSYLCL